MMEECGSTGTMIRRRRRGHFRFPTGLAMSLPAMIGLAVFMLLPFLLALGMSFTNLRLGSPLPLEFVGGRHYARLAGNPEFLRALLNNSVFALVVVPVQTVLALGMAVVLNREMQGMRVFRTLFFLPVVFPLSLVSVVWILIYAPGPNGLLNAVLEVISFGAWTPVDFLHDPFWALPAVMLTSIWQGVGFQMVVLLAGLQEIPATLYDAATLDGAGPWQRFRHITLPQLRNPLIFVVVVTAILSFRVFDQVRIMTHGGPGSTTATMVFEAVRAAFDRAQVSRGAAMTVVFFLVVLGITGLIRYLFRADREVR